MSTAPVGRVTPSRRNLLAPQSNSTKSMGRLSARNTLTASAVTSGPTPSPGTTATRAAGPPRRKGILDTDKLLAQITVSEGGPLPKQEVARCARNPTRADQSGSLSYGAALELSPSRPIPVLCVWPRATTLPTRRVKRGQAPAGCPGPGAPCCEIVWRTWHWLG